MKTRRLEWLVILILLLLNLFLLGKILTEQAAARREQEETRASVSALLRQNGITPAAEVELVQSCPASYTMERSLQAERAFAQRLLGEEAEEEELGGNIRAYTSRLGSLVMRGTGGMDLNLSEEGSPGYQTAERYFAAAGREYYASSAGEDGDGGLMLCYCGWNGYPVFNSVLSLRFEEAGLAEVAGVMPFTEGQADAEQLGMDSVTALVHFLDLVRQEGIICSRLEELVPGYMMSVTVSGESVLTPVWHIVTDTVELYLDAVTGASTGGGTL